MIAPRIAATAAATPTVIGRAVWRTRDGGASRALGHGQPGGHGQAAGVGLLGGADGAGLQREAEVLSQALDQARDRHGAAGDDAELDGLRALLGAIEVQRLAD